MILQVDGVWMNIERPTRDVGRARKPQPLAVHQGEDTTVVCKLVDSITGAPVVLALPTDTITLRVGFETRVGAQYRFAGVAAPSLYGAGFYSFTVPASTTKLMSGPWVYDVQVVHGGVTQVVTALAYFNVDSTV